MKIIKLTRGKEAIIDDEDLDLVSQYKWRYGVGGQGGEFAMTGNGNMPTVRMHRLVMGALKGQEVDHINGNGLDNRKSNLRFVTRAQNNMNKRIYKHSKSPYKGLTKYGDGWKASIYFQLKRIHLGVFKTPEEAALAYNAKATELFGEYASLNIIDNNHSGT